LDGADTRDLAYGLRRSPFYVLNDEDILSIKNEISALKADETIFIFNDGRFTGTAYVPALDIISVKGNVFPGVESLHPRDCMSARAVLAHEYYGHRPYRDTTLGIGDWRDEFRASYMAAKNAPGLSEADRRYLILDALLRAKEVGASIKHNSFIRRMLYGQSE